MSASFSMNESEKDFQLVEINVEYSYYGSTRTTPVFLAKEQLCSMKYDEFTSFITSEIPHLRRIHVPLRYCLTNDANNEIDISSKYCTHQLSRLVVSGVQAICIKVVESESPLSSFSRQYTTTTVNNDIPISKPTSSKTVSSIRFSQEQWPKTQPPKSVSLPLERYTKKQDKELATINEEIDFNRSELKEFDSKLRQAARQNDGPLSACGNCHLKMGHTRRNCTFSPCKSAFSCGILTKHLDAKAERASKEKNIKSLSSKLTKAQSQVEHTKMVIQKVTNTSSKRIEEIIVKEFPQRYIARGFRNWALLNHDVVRLAEKLKGVLPTRDNVLPLLNNIVTPQIDQETLPLYYDSDDDDNAPLADCGSRVLPQKRLLEEQFAIRFPSTKTKRSRELFPDRSSSTFQNAQQEQDFKLAVELQHAENITQDKCDRGNLYDGANDDENSCHTTAQATATNIGNDTDDSQGTVNAAASALLSLNHAAKR